jgi:uncharacterized protein (DUF362 family)
MLSRRKFVIGSAVAASSAMLLLKKRSQAPSPPQWERAAYRKRDRSRVAIIEAKSYELPLEDVIRRGIKLFRLNVQGKTIVLKPNLVEYDPAGAINTHPTVISATIDAFKSLGAHEVLVAESSGLRRDTEYLLTASGLNTMLKDYKTPYVDLDYDEVRPLKVRSSFTGFPHFYLPETILKADLLVTMPKLKTHHWAGVTLCLKNMFGIIPGAIYGWPKNILHMAGIDNSIVDISSTLPVPQFAIVDGIVGMEGDGPIQGNPKPAGVLLFGDDPVAVDATAARIMLIDPLQVPYLQYAEQFLGNVERERIVQVGEQLETFQQDFRVISSFQHLKTFSG